MYTLSSTDSATKSIDMSSLGGFTWNMWINNNNSSSAVSSNVNSNNNSCGDERSIAMASSRSVNMEWNGEFGFFAAKKAAI
jgi:hypothetical protein